jgi:hypothetical protein
MLYHLLSERDHSMCFSGSMRKLYVMNGHLLKHIPKNKTSNSIMSLYNLKEKQISISTKV